MVLLLTIKSTGKTVQFQKSVIEVGRTPICDLLLEDKLTVSHHHATFFYEKEKWFYATIFPKMVPG